MPLRFARIIAVILAISAIVECRIMKKIINFLENINRFVGLSVRWFVLLMVLIQFSIVIMRYTLGYSSIAVNESVLYLHAAVFMLGAGYTLLVDGHVRVDIFYAKATQKTQAKIDLFGHLALLIPAMLAILYWSWPSVYNAWKIKEGAISVGGIPAAWVMKLLIPSFCILLLIQSLACLLHKILLLLEKEKPSQNTDGVLL